VDLIPGMFLYDVQDKSILILVRRFWSYEGLPIPPYAQVDPEFFKVWVWEIISSKDGKVIYSESGLINLIKADIFLVLGDI
jgi:hypothetical protein